MKATPDLGDEPVTDSQIDATDPSNAFEHKILGPQWSTPGIRTYRT